MSCLQCIWFEKRTYLWHLADMTIRSTSRAYRGRSLVGPTFSAFMATQMRPDPMDLATQTSCQRPGSRAAWNVARCVIKGSNYRNWTTPQSPTQLNRPKKKESRSVQELAGENRILSTVGIRREIDSKYVVSYGGGINSTAMVVYLVKNSFPLDYVVFSDTGDEMPETYEYLKGHGKVSEKAQHPT